jgi:uncharacterized phage infection (PIP) family protein YhgE
MIIDSLEACAAMIFDGSWKEKTALAALALDVALFVKAFFEGASLITLGGYVLLGLGLALGSYYTWKYRYAVELETSVKNLKETEQQLRGEVGKLDTIRTHLSEEVQKFSTQNTRLNQSITKLEGEVGSLHRKNQTYRNLNRKNKEIQLEFAKERRYFTQLNRQLSHEVETLGSHNETYHQENLTYKANNAQLSANITRLESHTQTLDEQLVTLKTTHAELANRFDKAATTLENILGMEALKDLKWVKDLNGGLTQLMEFLPTIFELKDFAERLKIITSDTKQLHHLEQQKLASLTHLEERFKERERALYEIEQKLKERVAQIEQATDVSLESANDAREAMRALCAKIKQGDPLWHPSSNASVDTGLIMPITC